MMFSLCFLLSFAAFAENTYQINVGTPLIERADSVEILDGRKLSGAQYSDEILRSVSGLTVVRSGGPGQPSFVYIRGADSEGTLVLIDGIPANDPSLNNKAFDFSLLSLDNIARIEVWKGPQSVAFGSGASGGAINIITKNGSGPPHAEFGLEGGSYNSFKASAQAQGERGPVSYSLNVHRIQSNGVSAASAGSERDGTWINTFSTKLGWKLGEHDSLEFIARYSDRYAALDFAPADTAPFIYVDAINYGMRGDSLGAGLTYRHQWWEGFDSDLSVRRFSQTRRYMNDPQKENPVWLRQKYSGEDLRFGNVNTLKVHPGGSVSFGPEAEFENAATEYRSNSFNAEFPRQDSTLAGGFARYQYDQRHFFVNAGARVERHNRFGTQTAVEVGPGLHLTKDLDLLTRFATAYKAPTLYELFDPTYGNPSLRSERVAGAEVTLTQFFDSRSAKVQLALFQNECRELVQFAANRYSNVGSATSKGVEISAHKTVGIVDGDLGYTYLEARDNETGLGLLRRPRNSLSVRAGIRPSDRWNTSLDWVSVDHREDLNPVTNARMLAASYQVLNATMEWHALRDLKFYARALNLMDLKYEETAGYGTYRRSFFIGAVYGL